MLYKRNKRPYDVLLYDESTLGWSRRLRFTARKLKSDAGFGNVLANVRDVLHA